MIELFRRLFTVAATTPQNAHTSPQTAQTRCPWDRVMEELAWQAEALEWELERQKRQEIIEMAELARELAALEAEAKRQWSRRMHQAKAAKRLSKKAA